MFFKVFSEKGLIKTNFIIHRKFLNQGRISFYKYLVSLFLSLLLSPPSFLWIYECAVDIMMSVTTETNGITAKCRMWSWIYSFIFLQYVQFPLFPFSFILKSQCAVADPNSHKCTLRQGQSNCSFIVSLCPYLTLFSCGKIERCGKDLQL